MTTGKEENFEDGFFTRALFVFCSIVFRLLQYGGIRESDRTR